MFEGRKRFVGVLTIEDNGQFGLELTAEAPRSGRARKKAGGAKSGSPQGDPWAGRKLVFSLDEVDRAKLVPKIDFRRQA